MFRKIKNKLFGAVATIKQFPSNTKAKITQAISSFKDDVLENVSILSSLFALITGIITAIVSYVMFIVNGGYGRHVDMATQGENIFSAVLSGESFSSETLSVYLGMIPRTIMIILLLTAFVCALAMYFLSLTNRGKMVLIIYSIAIVVIAVAFVAFGAHSIANITSSINVLSILLCVDTLMIIGLFVKLYRNSELAEMAILYSLELFIFVPILLWVLENIVSIFLFVLFAAIVIFIIFFVGQIIESSGDSDKELIVKDKKTGEEKTYVEKK
jgi:hypothetical protein